MNLTVVPFGNAHISGSTVSCQHGEKECEGNRWEQCGIKHNPDFHKHFPYYACLEKSKGGLMHNAWDKEAKKCAQSAGLDFAPIQTCFNGPESAELQKEYSKLTPKNHKYTPWVVLNGKVLGENDDFLTTLCKTFKGTKPAGCKKTNSTASDWGNARDSVNWE